MKRIPVFHLPLIIVFSCFPLFSFAGSLEKGFEALKIFDYFHAKELFEKSMKSHPSGAAYGLSEIFHRDDNPFYNIDSAYKYILLSEKHFKSTDIKEKENLLKLSINLPAIEDLKQKITQQAFDKTKADNKIESYNLFIKNHAYSSLKKEAIKLRNKLAFEEAKKINTPQSYNAFIATYPDAEDANNAKVLYEITLYKSTTQSNTLESYEKFIKQFPKSPYHNQAEDSVFSFSTKGGAIQAYHSFIKKYSENRNVKKAWETIYSLYTLDFTPAVIEDFLFDFPAYPDKQKVKKDLAVSKLDLYPVSQNGKWGYMDSIGNNIIDFLYDEASGFHAGLAAVGTGEKYGVINKSGRMLIPIEYDDITLSEIKNIIPIIHATKKSGTNKYFDKKGKVIVDLKIQKSGDFFSNRAYIIENEKYGFINIKGEVIIAPQFEWAEDFNNNAARVKQNEKFGMIDTTGKLLLSCEYDRIDNFSEDLARVVKEKKIGFVDRQGNIVIPIKHSYSPEIAEATGFQNGLAKVEQNKKRGLMDKTGKMIIPCEFDDIRNFYSSKNDSAITELCAVKKNGKWGYMDRNKKQKIKFQFDYAWDFSEGLARVKQKGKTGFINTKGEAIVPAIYDEASDFKENTAVVLVDGKKGLIDVVGNLIIPCEMDEIRKENKRMIRLEKNGKLAYFNLSLNKQVWAEKGF